MSEVEVKRVTDDLLLGSQTLAAAGQWTPALVLAFCAVDVCASLARDPNKPWVRRQDFIKWVARYILPVSVDLQCTAEDLYAARCGLVHAYSSESSNRVAGCARELVYVLPKGSARHLLARPGTVSAVYVDISVLLDALAKGVQSFLRELHTDAELGALVKRRTAELLRFCDDI